MISVVIPLYNKEQSISQTLDSVIRQTYSDFEIVVVDDGSTDGSADVVNGFDDKRIRLISKKNGGVSSARNKGILSAKGDYIAFLDGDDIWDETYLETLHNLIEKYPDAALYGIGYGRIKDGIKIVNPSGLSEQYMGIIQDVWNHYPGIWTGSSSSSSRAKLMEVGLFDERITYGEDIDMWWRLLLSGYGVVDNKPLAWYRLDAENRAMDKLMPLEKHIPYFIDKYEQSRKDNLSFRKYFDTEMIYRLYPYLFDNKYRKASKQISEKLDYTQLKWTLKFRMIFPYIYRLYEKFKFLVNENQ